VADILNREFVRILTNSGWSQSEAAEKLRLSPAVISKYVSGETRPSLTVLKLFKLLIGDHAPLPGETEETALETKDASRPLEDWESDILISLRAMETDRRKRVTGALKILIGEIPKRDADYRKKGGSGIEAA